MPHGRRSSPAHARNYGSGVRRCRAQGRPCGRRVDACDARRPYGAERSRALTSPELHDAWRAVIPARGTSGERSSPTPQRCQRSPRPHALVASVPACTHGSPWPSWRSRAVAESGAVTTYAPPKASCSTATIATPCGRMPLFSRGPPRMPHLALHASGSRDAQDVPSSSSPSVLLTSSNRHYVAHDLALLHEIRTCGVVREVHCRKNGWFCEAGLSSLYRGHFGVEYRLAL